MVVGVRLTRSVRLNHSLSRRLTALHARRRGEVIALGRCTTPFQRTSRRTRTSASPKFEQMSFRNLQWVQTLRRQPTPPKIRPTCMPPGQGKDSIAPSLLPPIIGPQDSCDSQTLIYIIGVHNRVQIPLSAAYLQGIPSRAPESCEKSAPDYRNKYYKSPVAPAWTML